MPRMASAPARARVLDELSDEELNALLRAATWYAKYHERMIADLADDRSALAVTKRRRFQDLYWGLSKLGVRLRRPPGIAAAP